MSDEGNHAVPPTDPSACASVGGDPSQAARPGRTERRERPERRDRPGLVPANVFFALLDGRVNALLVGRDGEVRVQAGARERWRLVRVDRVVRHLRPGRITLSGHGDRLTLRVLGPGEADHHDLGEPRPRGWRRVSGRFGSTRRRARRQAAERLSRMIG